MILKQTDTYFNSVTVVGAPECLIA